MNQEIVVEVKDKGVWKVLTASCGHYETTAMGYYPNAIRPQIRLQMVNAFGISSQLMLYIANPAVDFAKGVLGNQFRVSLGYSGYVNGLWTNTIAPIFIGKALNNGTQIISNGTDQILQLTFTYQANPTTKYNFSDNSAVKIDDFLKQSFPKYTIEYFPQVLANQYIKKNTAWSQTNPTWQQVVQHFKKVENLVLTLSEKESKIVVTNKKVNEAQVKSLTATLFNNESQTCIKNPYSIIGYGGIMHLELAFVMPNVINKQYVKIENPNTNFYIFDTTNAKANISSFYQITSQEITFDTFTGESNHTLKLLKV